MQIHVETLGSVAVTVDGRSAASLLTKPVRSAVFLYVVLEPNPTRDVLIDMFWSDRDAEKARRVCTQTLYQLRQDLGGEWVVAAGNRLEVHAQVSSDVGAFERAVAEDRTEDALALYRGPFLRDLGSVGGAAFEHWTERIRGRAERQHRKARKHAVERALERGDLAAGLALTRQWVEIDPLDDDANHQRIALLARAGSRDDALRCFDLYAERVRRELDVDPLDETVRMVDAIRDGSLREMAAPQVPPMRAMPAVPSGPARPTPTDPAPVSARTGSRVAMIGVATVMAVVALLILRPWSRPQSSAVATPALLDPSAFAILPFELWSNDRDLQFIANAIRETVALELHGNDRLRVVSNPAVRRVVEDGAGLDSIARRFQAGSIVSGAVLRVGDSVRVDFGVTDARFPDNYIPSRVQRPDSEVHLLEGDVLAEIGRFLRERLGRRIELARTLPPDLPNDAYTDFGEAQLLYQEVREGSGESVDTRIRMLDRADTLLATVVRRSPEWTAPRVLRGWVSRERARAHGRDVPRWQAEMGRAVDIADGVLASHPDEAAALELRGVAQMYMGAALGDSARLRAALGDLERAKELDPFRASTWQALSFLDLQAGRIDEAQRHALRAYEEDRFGIETADLIYRMATTMLADLRDEDALNWCERGVREYPSDFRFAECALANAAVLGKPPLSADSAARLVLRADRLDPPVEGRDPQYRQYYRRILLGTVLLRRSMPDSAQRLVDRVVAEARGQGLESSLDYDLAFFHLVNGDAELAHATWQRYIRRNPGFASFARRDRRWPAWFLDENPITSR